MSHRRALPGERLLLPEEQGELACMMGNARSECPFEEPLFARAWRKGWDLEHARKARPIASGHPRTGVRRAPRGPFFSPAWEQGYFEAEDVAWAVLRGYDADRGRLEPPPGSSLEGRQAMLDYVSGALACFAAFELL